MHTAKPACAMQCTAAYFRASTSHNNKGNFEQQQSVEEALWSRPKPRFIVSPTKTLPPKQTCLRAFILLCLQPLVFPGVRELLPNTSCLETKSNALDAFQMPPGWIRLYK